MKKVLIGLIILIGLSLLIGTAYLIDRSRMKNNEEVIFSTWGYKYAPQVEPIKPPKLNVFTDNNKAECITGTYSWQEKSKNGKITFIEADSLQPIEFEYKENNILNVQKDEKIYLENEDINIESVTTYKLNQEGELKSLINVDNIEKSLTLTDIPEDEYILEINTSYTQGEACYGIRVKIK